MIPRVELVEVQKVHWERMYLWELDKEIQMHTGIEHPRTYNRFLHSMSKYEQGEKPYYFLKAIEANGLLVGKIELSLEEGRNYLGIVLASQRDQGIGTQALSLFLREVKQQWCVNRVYTEVYEDNERSLHFFRKNYFTSTEGYSLEWYKNKQRKLLTLMRDL